MLEGSRASASSYVYANLLGNEAGRAIYDGGAMIASAGKLVAIGPRFSFADRAADLGARWMSMRFGLAQARPRAVFVPSLERRARGGLRPVQPLRFRGDPVVRVVHWAAGSGDRM